MDRQIARLIQEHMDRSQGRDLFLTFAVALLIAHAPRRTRKEIRVLLQDATESYFNLSGSKADGFFDTKNTTLGVLDKLMEMNPDAQ